MTDCASNNSAVLLVSFGGPERPEDVRPFLQRVTGGRVPAERLEEVAQHYDLFGGRSPLNELTRRQAATLEAELDNRGASAPIYIGTRNWHPLLDDTVAQMSADGVRRFAAVILSCFQGYSSWDRYREDVDQAVRTAAGDGCALEYAFTRPLFDDDGFITAMADNVRATLGRLPPSRCEQAQLVFTAHSLPLREPDVDVYVGQLRRSCQQVAARVDRSDWELVYQSRTGRPQDPWLEPDVNDALVEMKDRGVQDVVVIPIGFVCDHIEVLYDLDIQAAETARGAGVGFHRVAAVNDAKPYISALADSVIEVLSGGAR